MAIDIKKEDIQKPVCAYENSEIAAVVSGSVSVGLGLLAIAQAIEALAKPIQEFVDKVKEEEID